MSKFKYVKEFVYENKSHMPELICDGEYKEYYYAITSLGVYPCAYVEIPKESILYKCIIRGNNEYGYSSAIDKIERYCNGIITYLDFGIPTGDFIDNYFIGWDYKHCWDYIPKIYNSQHYHAGNIISHDGIKWTNDKIIKQIKDVIDCLVEMEKICLEKEKI